jgi:hypothetical protein
MSGISNSIPQILFKEYLNVPSNRSANAPFYTETEPYNNYVIGDEVFLNKIPKDPQFNEDVNPYNDVVCSKYEKDTTNVLERFTKLQMTKKEGSIAMTAYTNGVNLLKDGFQFNYSGSTGGAFDYQLFVDDIPVSRANERFSYIYNYRSGYISFYGEVPEPSRVKFTFVHYIGKKGIGNLPIDVDGNYTTSVSLIKGTEEKPAYSFTSDTKTGMYLPSEGILGFSANGGEMLRLDRVNIENSSATLNANNIRFTTSKIGINVNNNSSTTFVLNGNMSIGLNSQGNIVNAPTNGMRVQGNTNLIGTLNVESGVTLSRGITINNNQNTTNLIKGSTTFESTLDISDNVLLRNRLDVRNDVSFQSQLDVSENVLFRNRLDVVNDVSFLSNLDISENVFFRNRLDVVNDVSMLSELDVSENVLFRNRLDVVNDVSMLSQLDVSENVLFRNRLDVVNDVSFFSKFDVSENAMFRNRLDVVNDVSMLSQLDVSENALFRNRLDVVNDVSFLSNLDVSENVLFRNRLDVVNDVSMLSELDVSENVLFRNRLDVVNDVSMLSELDVSDNVFFRNRLDVVNDVSFLSKLDVSENVLFRNRLDVVNDVSMLSELDVSDNVLFRNRLDVINDVSFLSKLDVSENVLFRNRLDVINDVSFLSKLDVSENVLFRKRLDVVNDVSFLSDLDVSENVLFRNRLDVVNDVSFLSDLDVSENVLFRNRLDVVNDVSFLSKLDVSENVLFRNRLDVVNDVSFLSNLDVSENVLFRNRLDVVNDVSFLNNLDVSENVLFRNRFDVINDVSFLSDLDVSENVLFRNRLDVVNDVSFLSNLDVSENVLFRNRLDVMNDVSFLSNLDVSENVLFRNRLDGMNDVSFLSNLDVSGGVLFRNRLDVINDVSFLSNLDVSGEVLFRNRLDVINDVSFLSKLDVSENVLFRNRLDIVNDVSMLSMLDVSENVMFRNRLDVINDVSLQSMLDVSENALFRNRLDVMNDVSFLSKLDVSENVMFRNRLDVVNDVSFLSNLDVSGEVLFRNRFDVINDVSFLSQLDVSENVLFRNRLDVINDVSFLSNLDVSENVLFRNRLDVVNDVSFLSSLDVSGEVLFRNRLDVVNDVSFLSKLDVSGGVLFRDRFDVINDVSFLSNLDVSEKVLFRNRLDVVNDVSFLSDLDVSGEVLFRNRLDVVNDVSFLSKLDVSREVLFRDRLDVVNDVSFLSNLDVSGEVLFRDRLDVVNDVSFLSKLDVSGEVLFRDRLDVVNDVSMLAQLDVSENALFRNRLDVVNDVSMLAMLDVSGEVLFRDRLDIYGDVEISSNLLVKTDAHIKGDFTADGNVVLDDILETTNVNRGVKDYTQWSQVSNEVEFGRGFAYCANGSTIFVLGGIYGGENTNRVLKSSDFGSNWEVVGNDGWSTRSYHSAVYHNGTIYVLGGENSQDKYSDFWKSENEGVTWTKIGDLNKPISNHTMEVIYDGDKYYILVLLGIERTETTNDLNIIEVEDNYSSKILRYDIVENTWTNVNTLISARVGHASCVKPYINGTTDKIYITGGKNENDEYLNDIWMSDDLGNTWRRLTISAEWGQRMGHKMEVISYRDIYLFGGINNVFEEYNDVWKSTDNGYRWIRIINGTDWGRAEFGLVQNEGDFLIFGGLTATINEGNPIIEELTDVWKSGTIERNVKEVLIRGDLEVEGDLLVKGDTYMIHTEHVEVKNNVIRLNTGVKYDNTSDVESGLHILRGKAEQPFKIVYNDSLHEKDEYLQVGIDNNLQRVATISALREEKDKHVPYWDAQSGQLHTDTIMTLSGGLGIGIPPSSGTVYARNMLDVGGNVVIGRDYAGVKVAPENGLLVQGDVSFSSMLDVSENVLFRNRLDVVNDVSLQSMLDVSENVLFRNRLDVVNDVSLQSMLDVSENVLFRNRLDVVNDVSLQSMLDVSENVLFRNRLDVVNDVSLQSMLDVSENVLFRNRLDVVNDVSMLSMLDVSENVLFRNRLDVVNDVSMLSMLDVSENVLFRNRLDVVNDVSLQSMLDVSENALFRNRLDVVNDVSLQSMLDVSENVLFRNRLDVVNDVSLQSMLDVSENVLFRNRLDVVNDVSMLSMLDVSENVLFRNRLDVVNDVSMLSMLDVSENVLFRNRLDVVNDVSLQSMLDVSENVLFRNRLDVVNDVSLQSMLDVSENVLFRNRLDVVNDVSLQSMLDVSENVLFRNRLDVVNDVSLQSMLDVSENVLFRNRLDVVNDVSLQSMLDVSENVLFRNRLDVVNDVSLQSMLDVSENVLFRNRLDVVNDVSMLSMLDVSENVLFRNRLDVVNDVSLQSMLDVSENVLFRNRLDVVNDVSLQSMLDVSENALFRNRLDVVNDVSLQSMLDVSENVLFRNRLDVVNDVSLQSMLDVSENVLFRNRLDVVNDVSLQSMLDVSENALFRNRLDVVNDVSLQSMLDVSENVLFRNRLDVVNDVSLQSMLDVSENVLFRNRLDVVNDVSMLSMLDVSENVMFRNRLDVVNDVSLQSMLDVSENVLFRNRLDVVNDVSLQSMLDVSENVLFRNRLNVVNDVSMLSQLDVSENVLFRNRLNVVNDVSLQSMLDVSENVLFRNRLDVVNDVSMLSMLDVSENVLFRNRLDVVNDVSMLSMLDVSENVMFRNRLDVVNDVSLQSMLDVSENVLFRNRLDVVNDVSMLSMLDVSENVLFRNRLDVVNDVSMLSMLDVSENVMFRNRLDVVNDVSMLSMLDVSENVLFRNRLDVVNDVSLQSMLDVSENVLFRNRLNVVNDVSLQSMLDVSENVLFRNRLDVVNDVSMLSMLDVSENVLFRNRLDVVNDVSMLSMLDVSENVLFRNRLDVVNDVSMLSMLDVSENVLFRNRLNVVNDVSMLSMLDVSENVLFRNRLDVVNDVSMLSQLDVSENVLFRNRLDVVNDVSMLSQLDVSENVLFRNRLDVVNDVSMLSQLDVSENVLFRNRLDVVNDVSLQSMLDVSENVLFRNRLDVVNDVSLQSMLDVSENVLFRNRLDVVNDVSLHSMLDVSENVLFRNRLDVINDVSLQSMLDVSENVLFRNRLDVINDVSFLSKFDVSENVLFRNRLDVVNDVSMLSMLDVSENVLFRNRLDVINDVSMLSQLDVSENVLFRNRLNVVNDVSLQSMLDVSENVLFRNRLNVVNDVSLQSMLDVSENVLFRNRLHVVNDVSLQSMLDVSENVLFRNRLDVVNDVSMLSMLDVSENVLFRNRLDVVNDVSMLSMLDVSENVLFRNRLDVVNDVSMLSMLDVSENVLFRNRLDVVNDVSMLSMLDVSENVLFRNRLDVVNDVSMLSQLDVSENALFRNRLDVVNDVSMLSMLDVSENVLFRNRLDVVNDVSMLSMLDVSENVLFRNRLDVVNDVSMLSQLDVSENALFRNRLDVINDVSFLSNLDVSENVLFRNRLDVINDVSFLSNLDVSDNALFRKDIHVENNATINNNLVTLGNVSLTDTIFTSKTTQVINNYTLWKQNETNLPPRFFHAVATDGVTIYVTGGINTNNELLDDMWKSTNGIVWEQIQITGTYWSPRSSHTLTYSNAKLYIIGGVKPDGSSFYSDIWISDDNGQTWLEITSLPTNIANHTTHIINDEIYVVGGTTSFGTFSDKLYKYDTQWNTIETNLRITNHSSVILSDNRILLFGNAPDNSNKLLISTNLTEWTEITHTIPFRTSSQMIIINDDIYILGGYENTIPLNDIWKSSDNGTTWTQIFNNDIWTNFNEYKAFVLNAQIYLIGGYYIDGDNVVYNNTVIYTTPQIITEKNTRIKGNLEVDGDMTVKGKTTYVNTEEILVKNNIIDLNVGIEGVNIADIESGIVIRRGLNQEPFKIIYDDSKHSTDEYLEIGISGELQRVATIKAQRKTETELNNDGAVPVWDASFGRLDVERSQISISNERVVVGRDLQITGKLFDADGDEFTAGASIVKGDTDELANELLKNKQSTGDLYFNTTSQLFRMHHSSLGGWVNTELGRIGSQPPPVQNLQYRQTTGFIELAWENPVQIATAMTSDLPYNKEHSPAALVHPITDQNIIYFPIVNRICVLLEDMNGNIISYPMYQSNNAKVDSSFSQIVPNGNVVYRKGDKVSGQVDSSRNAYSADDGTANTLNRNLTQNMPNKLRIYKTVPSNYGIDAVVSNENVVSTDLSFTIMPFLTSLLSVPTEEYKVSLWLENNSLQEVNILTVDVSYEIAGAPAKPNLVDTEFYSTASTTYSNSRNPLVRCKLVVEDPSFVAGLNNENDAIVNFERVVFEWSLNNSTWKPFKKMLYNNENIIVDNSGNWGINRPVDSLVGTRTQYEFFFDLSGDYMEDVFDSDLFKIDSSNSLYVGVRYKNTSNPNIGTRGVSELVFDTPTKSQKSDLSFVSIASSNNTICRIVVQDPEEILINYPTENLKITGIQFEWTLNDTDWNYFKKLDIPSTSPINPTSTSITLDASGTHNFTETMTDPRTERTYTFQTTSAYMGENVDTLINTGKHELKYRVSYRNSAKIVFSEDVSSNVLIFEPPSQTRSVILEYDSSPNVNMSVCKINVIDPEFVIKSYDDKSVNSLLKYTATNFEWSIDGANWTPFSKIFDGGLKELTNTSYKNGIYDISRSIIDTEREYTFDISNHYMADVREKVYNSEILPQPLYTRSAFRNSTKREFGEDLSSNVLYFDKPSIPRSVVVDYEATTSDSLTRCVVKVFDPSFVLNYYDGSTDERTPITTIQFSRIRFQWKIGENWNDFNSIDDGIKRTLTETSRVNRKTQQENERLFYFDISASYMNNTPNDILVEPTQLQLRIAYQNTTVAEFSNNKESNLLQTNPPSAPQQVGLSFIANTGIFTKCKMVITEPEKVIKEQEYNDKIHITGIKFEWSAGTDWYEFEKIDIPTATSISDGILPVNRILSTTSVEFSFLVNQEYMGTNITEILTAETVATLFVRISYRNSTTNIFGNTTPNETGLLFNTPSAPIETTLSYILNDTNTSITRCNILVKDPSFINQSYEDNTLDTILRYRAIKFEWYSESTDWKPIAQIYNGTTAQTLNEGVFTYGTNTELRTASRNFWFEINNTGLVNASSILDSSNVNFKVRTSYQSTVVDKFSGTTESNNLINNVPDSPTEITISYTKTTTAGDTECQMVIIDPANAVKGQTLNAIIEITHIQYQWSINNTDWYNFNKIKLGSVQTLTGGAWNITPRLVKGAMEQPDTYTFEINSEYMVVQAGSSNALNTLRENDTQTLYVRSRYRNSTTNLYGDYKASNDLSHNFIEAPTSVGLLFNTTTTDSGFTRCEINVVDPTTVYTMLNITGIKFQWSYGNTTWYNFNRMFLNITDVSSTIITDGIYNITTASRAIDTATAPRRYRFNIGDFNMGQDVLSSSFNIQKLRVRVAYRNSLKTVISDKFEESPDLNFIKPSAPDNVGIVYSGTETNRNTLLTLTVKDPLYVVGENDFNNTRVKFDRLKFEWYNTATNNWDVFKQIRDNGIKTLTNGEYDIRYDWSSTSRTYQFDLSDSDLTGASSLLDASSPPYQIKTRVSYKNYIRPEFGDATESGVLPIDVPSAPQTPVLELNETLSTDNTRMLMKIKDPPNVVKGQNHNNIKFTNIKFEWTLDGNWNAFSRIYTLSGTTRTNYANGIYNVLMDITTNDRLFYFDLDNTHLGNDKSAAILGSETVQNIKIRVSYMNSLINKYSEVADSSNVNLDVPSSLEEGKEIELKFDSVDGSTQKCSITMYDPENIVLGTSDWNSKINLVGIKFEWRINSGTWRLFKKMDTTTSFNNGVSTISRKINTSTSTYTFNVNKDYMGDDDVDTLQTTSETTLSIRVSFRNSIMTRYSSTIEAYNFLTFKPPSDTQTVSVSIVNPSSTNINTANTIIKLTLTDPNKSIDDDDNIGNENVNVKEIEFKWKNGASGTLQKINRLKIGTATSYTTLTNGVYDLGTSSRAFNNTTREYYLELTSADLDTFTNLTSGNYNIIFSVAYKNTALNETFNSYSVSQPLVIDKPNLVPVSDISLNMIANYVLEITLTRPTNNNVFSRITPAIENTNYGVFIKNVNYVIERRLDSGEYSELATVDVSYSAAITAGISVYTYSIPTGTSATTGYDLRVKMRLKNNILDQWSEYSATNDDTTEDANDLFIRQIKYDRSVTISSFSRTTLSLSWAQPSTGKRGVSKTSIAIPHVKTYKVKVGSLSEIIINQSNRTSDAGNSRNVDVGTLITGGNNSIPITIQEFNEFITNSLSVITGSAGYSLGNPGTPSVSSSVSIQNTLNTMTISWSGVSSGYSQDNSVSYTITITADKTNTSSPYYKAQSFTNTFFTTSTNSTSLFNITRNTTSLPPNIGQVIVYPDTQYTISVFATNYFNLSGSAGTSTISKASPTAPTDIALHTTANLTLPTMPTFTKYPNKGFLKTDTTKTPVFIINAFSLTSTHSATSMTGRMNNEKLTSYSTNVVFNDISNIPVRQLRIKNIATNETIFRMGNSTSLYATDTSDVNIGIPSITSTNRKDMFNRTGYDIYNQGYWWMEDIAYSINFTNKNNELYKRPIKLQMEVGYTLSTNTATQNTKIDASKVFLQDATNSNTYAYFDNLTGNPTIATLDSRAYIIEDVNTNKINGIPNLRQIQGKSYTYRFHYKLSNYSEYYELQKDISFTAIDAIGGYAKNNIKILTYDTSGGSIRGDTTWDISGLAITHTDITGLPTTTQNNIQFRIQARNTFGTANSTINTNLNTFISDSSSVVHLEKLLLETEATTVPTDLTTPTGNGQLMNVPADFDLTDAIFVSPNFSSIQQSIFTATTYNSYETYNPKQLLLYEGLFMTPARFMTKISSANFAKYGIPSTIQSNSSYSYSIFKFERINYRTASTRYQSLVMTFGSNTNFTYNDLINGNVEIRIQASRNGELNSYTETSKETTYSWVLYKPNGTSTTASVGSDNANVGYVDGLGSSGMTDSTDFTSAGKGIPAFTNTLYNTTLRNMTGVFYLSSNLAANNPNDKLTFYVSVAIKNNVSLYFDKIVSFDIYSGSTLNR